MNRIWASLLMAVFSFTLIDPGVFAYCSGQSLSPCCRMNGKHRCSMTSGPEGSSVLALRAGRCAWFRVQQTLPPVPSVGVVNLAQTVFASLVCYPTPRPQIEALGGVSFDCSSRKRGPPALC